MSSERTLARAGSLRSVGLTKVFDRSQTGRNWRAAVPLLQPEPVDPVVALDAIDLEIAPGEAVGFIGPNGAGKSTLLKLIAGVIEPTRGSLVAHGSIGSMIELGLGFHAELTGRENIYVAAVMLGLTRAEAAAAFDDVVAFAELEHAVDTPLKHYSTGMVARLGFAVATQSAVDLLLVDEVLSVGDREFQERCVTRIQERVAAGTTLLFVSHEMALVAAVCGRAVHLREGLVVDDGPAYEVVERYLVPTPSRLPLTEDGPIRLLSARIGAEVVEPWEPIELELEVVVDEAIERPELGVELTLPTVSPDAVFAGSSAVVPGLRTPGRHRVIGTSAPFPGEGGFVRATVTLLDGRRHELLGRSTCEFRIGGTQWSPKPHLAVDLHWECEPVATPTGDHGAIPELVEVAVEDRSAEAEAASKRFRSGLTSNAWAALPWAHRDAGDVLALDGVTTAVERGDAVGVIGPNGSGKSTLLKLLAGVMAPTAGRVGIEGRLVPVLELGVGFDGDLTGRENLWVSGLLLGMSREEVEGRVDEIIEYSGIGRAIDAPVKKYSTGMKARLGLAIALHADADVLLIDELLTVGDTEFRRQVAATVKVKQREGMTVVFVSHDLRLVEEICHRVIRLERGALVDDGLAAGVIDRYGGPSWAGGTLDAIAGIRIHDLQLARRTVGLGGDAEVHGHLEVIEPSDAVRIELSYRQRLVDGTEVLSAAEREERSFFLTTVEPKGGAAATRGWYRFTATVPRNVVAGEYDVVVSVVDEDENAVLTEAWTPLLVDRELDVGERRIELGVEWRVATPA